MGKGDMRSRRGKIFRGSYGKTRPKLKNTSKGRARKNTNKSSSKAAK